MVESPQQLYPSAWCFRWTFLAVVLTAPTCPPSWELRHCWTGCAPHHERWGAHGHFHDREYQGAYAVRYQKPSAGMTTQIKGPEELDIVIYRIYINYTKGHPRFARILPYRGIAWGGSFRAWLVKMTKDQCQWNAKPKSLFIPSRITAGAVIFFRRAVPRAISRTVLLLKGGCYFFWWATCMGRLQHYVGSPILT